VSEIEEGVVETHVKIKGIHYGLGLRLEDFPTEELLRRGLKDMNECLCATLREQEHW